MFTYLLTYLLLTSSRSFFAKLARRAGYGATSVIGIKGVWLIGGRGVVGLRGIYVGNELVVLL